MNIFIKSVSLCFAFSIFNILNPYLVGLIYAGSVTRIFYVATNGNDQWSGYLPAKNEAETDGPFATLQQARNAVRNLRKNGSQDAFTVLVRGGIYQLGETFVLGPEDSGTESHPLVFKAFENEHPILSGSKRVNNFVPYQGKICQADLTSMLAGSSSFKQVFAAGKRQTLARYPNFDPFNPIGGGFLYVENPTIVGNKREFIYQNGSVPIWSNLQGAEVVIYPGSNYTKNIVPLFGIDSKTRVITLSQDTYYAILSHNRFYIQKFMEGLDSPGEWYFNRQDRKLYFWPSNDAALQSVFIPVLQSIVAINGSDIRLEGFTMEGCEGDAIYVNGANRAVIARSTVRNAGGCGIKITNGFGNTAFGNDIYEVGSEGIYISGGVQVTLSPANHRAENNYIHHVGTGPYSKNGIHCGGVGNVVSHNLIHSTPRVGIWLEGNDHLIEYNQIHHVNQETEDSGAIYFGQLDWTKRGNIIRYNYIHDSGGFGWDAKSSQWKSPFYTFGIYLDDWTSGTKVFGNIIKDTASGGIFIHGGRDNLIENNLIIEGGRHGQMVYSAWPFSSATAQKWLPEMFAKVQQMKFKKYPLVATITDIETGAKMSGNSFVRNILYYTNPSALLYGIYNGIDLSTTVSDYNTIYHSGLPLLVPFTNTPDNKQWSTWQGMGLDAHSTIADPLFSSVADNDFTLLPGSPALKMGFQPIPFDKIGPYSDPLRASWPIEAQ